MTDVLTPEQRRLNMSRIRGKDTKPEMIIRKGLHAAGLRFRLHAKELPGRPDLVFPRHQSAIQVHGCFWHGHHCPMCRLPATRREFWSAKISGNRERDQRTSAALLTAGWRLLTIWECSLRGPARRPEEEVLACCSDFFRSGRQQEEVAGVWDRINTEHRATSA
ncbi:very short patch repair endonuclease [Pseudoroseomonas ludipueritiae]|uniref:DNA mismatch endonuclease Vsr n=1 Tax=Pseudoroseomonas ludipueritiae TaxID=198093 RepID=A0ABR7R326_9PROT|nr:very short patch repair endonuclease [Pseudoroseomonas ludipueritiae]MBC9176121.1 DNA mismatch endonuclease Vsr [Pseudoroseomonas ludipueritiae]